MRPIPLKLRSELERLPRMKRCSLADSRYLQYAPCSGRVHNPEWHHVFTYSGKQISEAWAILPACSFHHAMVGSDSATKHAFEKICLEGATQEDLARYPKKDWKQIKKYLNITV